MEWRRFVTYLWNDPSTFIVDSILAPITHNFIQQ